MGTTDCGADVFTLEQGGPRHRSRNVNHSATQLERIPRHRYFEHLGYGHGLPFGGFEHFSVRRVPKGVRDPVSSCEQGRC